MLAACCSGDTNSAAAESVSPWAPAKPACLFYPASAAERGGMAKSPDWHRRVGIKNRQKLKAAREGQKQDREGRRLGCSEKVI